MPNKTIQNEIQKLAYIKWLDAKLPQNRDLEFWLEAEKEVKEKREQLNPFRINCHYQK